MIARFTITFIALTCFCAQSHAQILTGYDHDVQQSQLYEPQLTTTQGVGAPLSEKAVTLFSLDDVAAQTAPDAQNEAVGEPVDFDADNLDYDEESQIITATGDVFLTQTGRILRADKVIYDLANDKVEAHGHVVVNEPAGDVYYAEYMELTDKMKNGFVEGVQAKLGDGATFDAKEGERKDGNKTIMHDARYTPCKLCGDDPREEDGLWQIRASEVTHHKDERRISYEHARFEILGMPVAYTPYFSHPDGTIDRKSGFLSPSFGYRSNLGGFAELSYYWNIAPDKDLTLGVLGFTNADPLALLEYRQRWNKAAFEIEGGITQSRELKRLDEEIRGHVLANGLWDINNKWRTGLDVEWASDDRYMRQYDFVNENVLENQLYVERFSGRNYGVGRLLAFQDIRSGDAEQDQPEILPEIIASFKGEPDSVPALKGRWGLDLSTLGLRRDGDGQDVNRVSAAGTWFRRLVSKYGFLTTANAQARWDFYSIRNRAASTPGSNIDNSSTDTRFFPNFNVQTSYPMAKQYETIQARVEPVVAINLAQNINVNDDIPNEDSQDVQLDASNLFEANRFPGYDLIEDTSNVTYGVRTGLYGHKGSYGEFFIGQSYRLDEEDTPFPEGSGLVSQESDVVGQITGQYEDQYSLDYRFQLDGQRLFSRRHELYASADWNRFRLNANYLFASPIEGTEFSESREQLTTDAQYYLAREWRLRSGARYDLGEDEGLRTSYVGLDYLGECLFWSVQGQRNNTDDESGESDNEIVFRIGLKNLGDFETSGLREEDGRAYSSNDSCKG